LMNAQAERMFGYQRHELDGQPIESLVPEAARTFHPQMRAAYVDDPVPRPICSRPRLTGQHRDGSTFPADISLSAVDTDEGRLVLATVRHITHQETSAEARLASIIRSSHDAVIGESLDRVITSWNPGAERLYGYSAVEMIGRHVDVLIRPDTRDEEKAIHAAITRGDRIEQFESDRVRKDGSNVSVILALSPIADGTGSIVGVS